MEMNNYKELIEKYRKSDFVDRIFLFMEYRDLRSEFLIIDVADAKQFHKLSIARQKSSIHKLKWLNPMIRVWKEFFSTSRPSSDSVEYQEAVIRFR